MTNTIDHIQWSSSSSFLTNNDELKKNLTIGHKWPIIHTHTGDIYISNQYFQTTSTSCCFFSALNNNFFLFE